MRAEKYDVLGTLEQSKRTFVIEGYVPEMYAASLEKELSDRFEVSVEMQDPTPDEDVPVLLKNGSSSEAC